MKYWPVVVTVILNVIFFWTGAVAVFDGKEHCAWFLIPPAVLVVLLNLRHVYNPFKKEQL
jgi:hypothetical protein